jgi:hypothetical protein
MSTKRVVWTTIAVVVGLIALSWAGFALSVALSGPKGVGNAIIQKNSAENWTKAQAGFEDSYQAIIAADRKIAVHRAALEAAPTDPTLKTNLSGVTNICISAVADYNADSRKFLKEDFKAADLPYQIDDSDPATDCK